ncbi:MAG: hypothetical protein NTZ50_12745 [Chloroflexi bacterium]|nr:hypothetical protein [Chloroflexota bacterium]
MPLPKQSLADALRHTSALSKDGQFAAAAAEYAALAAEAEKVRNRRRAANTHALAALDFATAREPNAAMQHARAAFKEFFDLRLYQRAPTFYLSLLRIADERKLIRLVDALRTEFSAQIVIYTAEARKESFPETKLPATCPGCGLAMRPELVDWISDARAECDFCGTVMDAQ